MEERTMEVNWFALEFEIEKISNRLSLGSTYVDRMLKYFFNMDGSFDEYQRRAQRELTEGEKQLTAFEEKFEVLYEKYDPKKSCGDVCMVVSEKHHASRYLKDATERLSYVQNIRDAYIRKSQQPAKCQRRKVAC